MTATFLEGFRSQVERRPDCSAVSDAKEALTYAELWQKAQIAAGALTPGRAHLIRAPRSAKLVVELLATWIAGAVPLLLSDSVPEGRYKELLSIVLSSGSLSGIEYLVSTSGSTGKPKVVTIGTGSLVRTLRQQIEAFQITDESKVMWMLSPSFDASLSDIGTALLAGAHLYCAPDQAGQELPRLLALHRITHLDIPPSVLALYTPGEFPQTLQTLVVGGEPSPPSRMVAWSRYHRVVAVYGPTEATICSSMSLLDPLWDAPYLGRPLDGVQYEVSGGQLLIGGPQVGLGYLGDVDGGFFEQDGVRWYASGDRVGRQHAKHGWEFLGRVDRQLKRHGQRIEPEEVERRAREHLGHGEVAVFESGGRLVLAYAGAPERELDAHLSRALPASWKPQHYLHLAQLPRTESYKIDYQSLLDLALHLPSGGELDSIEILSNSIELSRGGLEVDCRRLQEAGVDYLTGQQLLQAIGPVERVSQCSRKQRKKLLITGASGALGSQLASKLAERFEVYGLQRSAGGSGHFQGDLTKPKFGLSDADWTFLEEEIDEFVHLAADLNLTKSWSQLAPVNVNPLRRLANFGRPVHLASSLAATLSSSRPLLHGPLEPGAVVMGGYAQSKWMAEALLDRTGIPGYTFRLGHLLERPRMLEWLAMACRGLRVFGCAPLATREQPLYFDVTPLDWAAEECNRILNGPATGREIRVIRKGWGVHYLDLLDSLDRHGLPLARIPAERFFALRPVCELTGASQKGLVALHPQRRNLGWDAFDLFLLGRLPQLAGEASDPEALGHLDRYLDGL